MIVKRLKTAAMIAMLSTPVMAQDALELARQYTNMPAVQNMMDEMFAGDVLVAQMEANMGGIQLSDGQKDSLATLMEGMMQKLRPTINDVMIQSTAEVLNADEIGFLIDVYSTPMGAAVMGKTSQMMTSVQTQLGPVIMGEMMTMMPQIEAIMTEQ